MPLPLMAGQVANNDDSWWRAGRVHRVVRASILLIGLPDIFLNGRRVVSANACFQQYGR